MGSTQTAPDNKIARLSGSCSPGGHPYLPRRPSLHQELRMPLDTSTCRGWPLSQLQGTEAPKESLNTLPTYIRRWPSGCVLWPQRVETEPVVSGRYKKADFRDVESTTLTTVDAVGASPRSLYGPAPISQLLSGGRSQFSGAPLVPVVALGQEGMPHSPELPSANDRILEQSTAWYHACSRAPRGSRCSRSPSLLSCFSTLPCLPHPLLRAPTW